MGDSVGGKQYSVGRGRQGKGFPPCWPVWHPIPWPLWVTRLGGMWLLLPKRLYYCIVVPTTIF